MSHRRKHVRNTVVEECPTPGLGQKVLRVSALRGSNVLEVRSRFCQQQSDSCECDLTCCVARRPPSGATLATLTHRVQ